jgi:hypothetical protein
MDSDAETCVIYQKICAAPRHRINHRQFSLTSSSREAPKYDFQNDRAEPVDPPNHRQRSRRKKNQDESCLPDLGQQRNFFWGGEHVGYRISHITDSAAQIRGSRGAIVKTF